MPQRIVSLDLRALAKYLKSFNDSFAFNTYKSHTPLQIDPCTLDSCNEKIYIRLHLLLTM